MNAKGGGNAGTGTFYSPTNAALDGDGKKDDQKWDLPSLLLPDDTKAGKAPDSDTDPEVQFAFYAPATATPQQEAQKTAEYRKWGIDDFRKVIYIHDPRAPYQLSIVTYDHVHGVPVPAKPFKIPLKVTPETDSAYTGERIASCRYEAPAHGSGGGGAPPGVSGAPHINPDDTTGGFVADTADVAPTVYIGPNAKVFGHAKVEGAARIEGYAEISGNAHVSSGAKVKDYARVSGNAKVLGSAEVAGDAEVKDYSQVLGSARVSDAKISCIGAHFT